MNHIFSVLTMKFSGWLELILDFLKKLFSLIYEDNLQGDLSSSEAAKEIPLNQYYQDPNQKN